MKRIIAVILFVLLLVSLTGCGKGSMLEGTYISESGETELTFTKDGTCTMTEGGLYVDGTYSKTDSGWQLNLKMLGFISTTYQLTKSGKDLILSDGNQSEVFTKK